VAFTIGVFALGLPSPPALAQSDTPESPGTRRTIAVRIAEPIVLDGRLEEDAWRRAPIATNFLQQEPDEGQPATDFSEVRFLYDDHFLYVGGWFSYDADGIPIVNELKRDFSERDGDLVTIVLDTFRDGRNASSFMTNPAGALRDSQSYDDGRQKNDNWDAAWAVRTARFPHGWSMEVAIPFKSLRFRRASTQEWGLNLLRLVRRKNEVTVWSFVPRQFTPIKVSYAGVLSGLEGVRPGFNLRVKPFTVAQVRDASGARREDFDGGFDLKYGLGGSLALDATYRTDFSHVEADDQQVNLTRFSLFFPEKREFFLENQGAFAVGDQSQSASSGRRDLVPFFSRRIGLTEVGAVIPMRGGLRLSGRQGAFGLGLLQMWTDGTAEVSSTGYSAARLVRSLGSRLSIGALYLGTVRSDTSNRVAGADLHLAVGATGDIDAYVLRSATTGRDSDWAGRAALSIVENRYTARASYTNVGARFENEMGFVQRPDTALVSWEYERNVRPARTSQWVRTFTIGGEGDFFGDSGHRQLLTRIARTDFSAEFADGGRLGVDVDWNYERLTEPFEIEPGVTVQPSEYEFWQLVPSYSSDRSSWLSGSVKMTLGEFWSGRIVGVNASARVRFNERLAASAVWSRDRVTLPEGKFVRSVARVRADYSFSTNMFLAAFVQYNDTTRSWTSNVRFNLIHRPLSDLFVVFSDAEDVLGGRRIHALTLKYTHLLSF
jgi:hypothetical protein